MDTTFPLGIVCVHKQPIPAIPDEAQALLDNGTVLAFSFTCAWSQEFAPSWHNAIQACIATPTGNRWVQTWEDMRAAAIPGLAEAIVALTHPIPLSSWTMRSLWNRYADTREDHTIHATWLKEGLWLRQEDVFGGGMRKPKITRTNTMPVEEILAILTDPAITFKGWELGIFVAECGHKGQTSHQILHVESQVRRSLPAYLDVISTPDPHGEASSYPWLASLPIVAPTRDDVCAAMDRPL